MNKEKEIIKLLEECIAKDLWFEINNDNATLLGSYINKIEQENKKMNDNWIKLKYYLESNWENEQNDYIIKIMNKINELEKGE